MDKTYVITIIGAVQGAAYKNYIRNLAISNHVSGNVRNIEDGSLLVHAATQNYDIDRFISELQRGYGLSDVDCIKVEEVSERNFDGFSVLY